MVQNELNISLFLCSCLWFRITSLSPFLWRTLRLFPWPYPFQHVHHISQHSHLIPAIKSSPLCWWHSNIDLICTQYLYTAITQLQDTIFDISSWMTTSLLSLNPSKTEFMLISLPKTISKISIPSLSLPSNQHITPTHSVRNFGFIFDSSLTFSKQIAFYPVLATIISVIFAAPGTLSTSKQHLLSLLLLYILK